VEDVARRRRASSSRRLLHWLPLALWAGGILLLSAQPADELPASWFPFEDKLVHAAVYAVLGALAARAAARAGVGRGAAVLALVGACAFGLLDEWTQRFSPGRTPSLGDWAADGIGALAGFLLLVRYHRRRTLT
jgi:hypothetical protein